MNYHKAGPEYATQTRAEELKERHWEFAYGKEYHALCALQELVRTNSFTTLQEDVVLDAVTSAMEELEDIRNE